MDLCNHLTRCHVYGAEVSTIDKLPVDQPAVYAFYDIFRFEEASLVDEIDAFKTRHGRELTIDQDGMPEFMRLRFRGNPERFKGQGAQLCKSVDSKDVQEVISSLAFLSVLNDPLYIGKTRNVRTRFRAHHDDGFLYKMKSAHGRPARDFLFFAYYCDEKHVRLLESVLIQLINPPYCDQKT